MTTPLNLDKSTLQPFKDAAAGHDGTLSDPTGTLFIKPCTQAEVDFYTVVTSDHPHLAHFTPMYMGTLTKSDPPNDPSQAPALALALSQPTNGTNTSTPHIPHLPTNLPANALTPAPTDLAQAPALALSLAEAANANSSAESNTPPIPHLPPSLPASALTPAPTDLSQASALALTFAQTANANTHPPPNKSTEPDTTHLHGKPISSPLHIVLGSITSGLSRPNVLDLKLGHRLWDDTASLEKRTRLDKVAAASTSLSLGFRVAGMRIWEGHTPDDASGPADSDIDAEGVRVYNKLYGRALRPEGILDAFTSFLHVPAAGISIDEAVKLAMAFKTELAEVRGVLERTEVRLVSSSILFAYEGDGEAFRRKEDELVRRAQKGSVDGDGEDDGEESEEEEGPVLYRIKLIDFAHSKFVPGEGPDDNILPGVRHIERIFNELYDKLVALQEQS